MAKAYGVLPGEGDTEAPSIPQNLVATPFNAVAIDLTWDASTDNVGVTGYQVFRDGSPVIFVGGTSTRDDTLTPNTLYTYTVTAVDGSGNSSAASDPAQATTPDNQAPVWSYGNQSLDNGVFYSQDLDGVCSDADGDLLSYNIQSGVLPTGLLLSGDTISGTPTVDEVQSVTLRASDGVAFTDTVVQFTVTSVDVTPPAAPTNLATTNVSANSVSLNWDDNTEPDLNLYRVFRAPDGVNYGNLGPAFVSEYTDNTVSAGTTYYYKIKAVDTSNNASDDSNVVIVTTDTFGSRSVFYTANWEADGSATGGRIENQWNGLTVSNSGRAFCLLEAGGNGSTQGPTDGVSPAREIKVVSSLTVPANDRGAGEVVTPRSGNYMLTMQLDKNLFYGPLNPPGNSDFYDKPRVGLSWGQTPDAPGGPNPPNNETFKIDAWDDVYWIGWSTYLPTNFEVENGSNQGSVDNRTLQIHGVGIESSAEWTNWRVATKTQSASEAHWLVEHLLRPSSPFGSSTTTGIDFGPITDDRGEWTDWVVRYRLNPFSSQTTVTNGQYPGAVAGVYPGDNGIFEIWKTVGSGGSRAMRKVYSLVNEPVGTPPSDFEGGNKLWDFRMYKFGWKFIGAGAEPSGSTVSGPIHMMYDEMYFGRESLSQGYSDVAPGQGAEPTNTPVNGVDYTEQAGGW